MRVILINPPIDCVLENGNASPVTSYLFYNSAPLGLLYIAGVLDPTESDDDLREIIAPLLLDAAVAEDDDGAAALCDAGLRALRGGGSGDSTPAADAPLQLLGGPVSMATLVKADAQEEDAHVKEELGPVRVTVNSMDLNTKKVKKSATRSGSNPTHSFIVSIAAFSSLSSKK